MLLLRLGVDQVRDDAGGAAAAMVPGGWTGSTQVEPSFQVGRNVSCITNLKEGWLSRVKSIGRFVLPSQMKQVLEMISRYAPGSLAGGEPKCAPIAPDKPWGEGAAWLKSLAVTEI